MYEIAARKQPYDELWDIPEMRKGSGLNEVKIKNKVLEGLRPTMPQSTPPAFATLAQQLWATEPTRRPPTSQLLKEIAQMRTLEPIEDRSNDSALSHSSQESIQLRGILATEPSSFKRVLCLLFIPSDKRIWCGCDDGTVIIFKYATFVFRNLTF